MTDRNKTCEERIDGELEERVGELKHVMDQRCNPFKDIYGDSYNDVMDWLDTWSIGYGDDPHYRAKRLELSWGGPSDGFRFFEDGTIEYYFQDWFDGARRRLYGNDYDTLKRLYNCCLSF